MSPKSKKLDVACEVSIGWEGSIDTDHSYSITMSEDFEKKLEAKASAKGLSVSEYLVELVRNAD